MDYKEQFINDSVVCNQANTKERNLFAAYIEYSVPRECPLGVLNLYNVVTFLEHLMTSTRSKMRLKVSQLVSSKATHSKFIANLPCNKHRLN